MLATHLEAEQRYDALRKIALEEAQRGTTDGMRFSTITPEALVLANKWNSSPRRQVDWNWAEGYSTFRFRYPKRFELALWQTNDLLALSLGRPTYEGHHLRLDFVEARPLDLGSRIPVFAEILVAYGIYARLLNAKQIRIMHPLNDAVKDYYRSFGYSYVAKQDYLFKEIF